MGEHPHGRLLSREGGNDTKYAADLGSFCSQVSIIPYISEPLAEQNMLLSERYLLLDCLVLQTLQHTFHLPELRSNELLNYLSRILRAFCLSAT
jgi:hypothetical protein